jgi:DNA-binding response OmpR family regulator
MLGNIEEAIMANYKKALENGNYSQAKKATVLATMLRDLIEVQGFEDSKRMSDETRLQSLNIFKPVNYTYDPKSATIFIFKGSISLTEAENKLFMLLTQNETTFEIINLVEKQHIKSFVWPNKRVGDNAIRILVKRLRKKIEPNPSSPELLINYNRKGYLFLGKAD